MMGASDPESLHRLFAERASARDLEGLAALYEEGACYVGPDGVGATGTQAIRQRLTDLIALEPRITSLGSDIATADDIALISSRWCVTFGSGAGDGNGRWDGVTSEVARRQTDGSWRYVIDRPSIVGGPLPANAAAGPS